MKKCSHCKTLKSLNEFGNSKNEKDGLVHACKLCRKKYRDEHKEEIRLVNKKRWEKYKKEILERRRILYASKRKEFLKKTKFCNKCKKEKSFAEFSKDISREMDYGIIVVVVIRK